MVKIGENPALTGILRGTNQDTKDDHDGQPSVVPQGQYDPHSILRKPCVKRVPSPPANQYDPTAFSKNPVLRGCLRPPLINTTTQHSPKILH